jgi:lipoprotein-anchoring transpeptidase ErfK/SrfK
MTLAPASTTVLRGRAYVLTGDTVAVAGRVSPYVPGQIVRVRISTPKRKPTIVRARIRDGGAFRVRFRTRRAVTYTIYARHNATPEQALFAAKAAVKAVSPGQRIAVALLKQRLRALGYPAGNGPAVTSTLGRAVLAFRKTNNLARTDAADRNVYEMVFAGRGAFKLRYPKAGKHVEADLSRQVVVLADQGKVVATYPTSSGAPGTPTVLGHYHFYMKQPGTNAKQMYMSNYFIRGYAIHGYPVVPTYNASHGCLRVPNADAVAIFNWIHIGDPIWVYA